MVVSALSLLWNVTRTRRKLDVSAKFLPPFAPDSGMSLLMRVKIRNPRKVAIVVRDVIVTATDVKGTEYSESERPNIGSGKVADVTLEEGGELYQTRHVPQARVEPPRVQVIDLSGVLWSAKRIAGRRHFRRWRRAKSK